jgi:hypothetical protein
VCLLLERRTVGLLSGETGACEFVHGLTYANPALAPETVGGGSDVFREIQGRSHEGYGSAS